MSVTAKSSSLKYRWKHGADWGFVSIDPVWAKVLDRYFSTPETRWRMKQQRVRERRAMRAKFTEVRNKMVARRALGSAAGRGECREMNNAPCAH